MRNVAVVVAFLASGTVTAPATAMQATRATQSPGRWLPRDVRPFTGGLTPAQRAEAMATLEKIERIIKQVPEVANPVGYEILPVFSGGGRQQGTDGRELPGSVVAYGFGLMHFRPTRAIAGEGSVCLGVRINATQSGAGRLRDAQGREIYIEGERGKPSTNPAISDSRVPARATQVYGELWNVPRERSGASVLFVTAGPLPWTPVSREEFYNAVLLDAEGAGGEKLASYREGLKKTPYQVWLEGAAQRRKDREAALAQVKGILPDAEIEKMRQTQEATEREVAESLKKDEAMHRERGKDASAKSVEWRDNLVSELALMTPDERRMPAYINDALDHGPNATGWRITADEAPPAWRVLTPNFDFYRARRSPVEVRSITVTMSTSLTCGAPQIRQAVWRAYHTLDWVAISNLLEQPR